MFISLFMAGNRFGEGPNRRPAIPNAGPWNISAEAIISHCHELVIPAALLSSNRL